MGKLFQSSFGPLYGLISELRLVLRLPLYKGSVTGAPFPAPGMDIVGGGGVPPAPPTPG